MPRIKNIVDGNPDELAGEKTTGGQYTGKKPPKGVYKGKVRFLKLRGKKVGSKFVPQKNKNGDYMIRGAVSVSEKGAKARYNGYLINFNQNISKQGAPYVNQMLDSMFGGSAKVRREFWDKNIFVGIDSDGNITHIGKSRYTDNSIEVVVSGKDVPGPNDETVLEVAAWLLKSSDETEDADEEDEDADADEEDEDISFEDDDSDDSDDEDEDDESEDDPDDDETDDDGDADDDGTEGEDDEDGSDEAEDEDEDEDFDRDGRMEELQQLTRDELKAKLKELSSDAKVLKSDTVETLAAKIVDIEASKPPF